jgi:carboxypeptidase PM20D1
MLANVLIVLLVVFLFLIAFLLIRTILYGKVQEPAAPAVLADLDAGVIAEHLAAVLRYPTVSEVDRSRMDMRPFNDFRREIEQLYPRVHTALKVETVNRYSLLYTWTGRDPALAPVLLAGHMDVVPVDPSSRDEWKYPPFDGHLADGCIWGRGALDTKNTVISALEAVEYLLKTGYQPERTLLLGFGHDEEIGGFQGGAQIAGWLLSAGVQLEAILDEGGGVVQGVVPGISLPVAVIGVSEKGYLTLEMQVEGRGGHSSMPPPHTAVGVMARAIHRLESSPLAIHLDMVMEMFRYLGPYLPFGLRLVFANQWLFSAFLKKQLASKPRTNAMIRTTAAATLIQGGVKDNILPAKVGAAVNFRLMPGDRVADVEKYARDVIHDEAVQLHIPDGVAWEASPVSPFDSSAAKTLIDTLGQVFPDAVAAPYLVAGATDSRHYAPVCANIFRFSPYKISSDEMASIHASNERISIDGLAQMVQFYIQLIRSWTAKPGSTEGQS